MPSSLDCHCGFLLSCFLQAGRSSTVKPESRAISSAEQRGPSETAFVLQCCTTTLKSCHLGRVDIGATNSNFRDQAAVRRSEQTGCWAGQQVVFGMQVGRLTHLLQMIKLLSGVKLSTWCVKAEAADSRSTQQLEDCVGRSCDPAGDPESCVAPANQPA